MIPRVGSDLWGLGPSLVGLRIDGPWVCGALVNNLWSLGSSGSNSYNNFLLQPFINCNFGKTDTYLTSSPIATANWKTGQWIVPLGGGIGQICHRFGELPVNSSLQAYYNVAHPESWALNGRSARSFSSCSRGDTPELCWDTSLRNAENGRDFFLNQYDC